MLGTPLLEVDDLSVRFTRHGQEPFTAVDKVTFNVAPGEVVGLVGESGCGKSVTSLAIMRLLARRGNQVTGSVRFAGTELLTLPDAAMRDKRGAELAMIFQDPLSSLNPVVPIGVQVAEVITRHRGEKKAVAAKQAAEMLDKVGIPDPTRRLKEYPHQLSGGMRQRALIAMALACEPRLLIADEPTTALDVTIQAQILELMNDLRHKLGMSIIMITDDLGVVAQMCEKIAVMYAGHIVEYGTTDEIFYNPQHEYTKGLINSIPKLNAEEKERLVPIEGQPVDLLNPPAGCPFAPRCKSCMKVCLNKMPPRTELSDTHYTYCWLRQKEEFEKGGKA